MNENEIKGRLQVKYKDKVILDIDIWHLIFEKIYYGELRLKAPVNELEVTIDGKKLQYPDWVEPS